MLSLPRSVHGPLVLASITVTLTTLLTASAAIALPEASWSGEGIQNNEGYGFGAATAGDVNGDGYSDVIIGSPYYDSGLEDRGRVWVHYGSPTGIGPANWQEDGEGTDDLYGYSVACVGDTNGDGYDDVLVGAALADDITSDDGTVYLYYGSAAGLSPSPGWTKAGVQSGALYGSYVAAAGDVNGDGYDDFIYGGPGYDSNGLNNNGRIDLYFGGPGAPTLIRLFVGDNTIALVGTYMASLDANGDGYSDLVISSFDPGLQLVHKLYLGSPTGPEEFPVKEYMAGDLVTGGSVSTAGDVNGDGYEDLLIGFPGWDQERGKAVIWYGTNNFAGQTSWEYEGESIGDEFATAVGCAGDVNGDGYSDFLVHNHNVDSTGEVNLFYGSVNGPTWAPVWTETRESDPWFGWRVGTAGDVNGDGFSELLVSSPYEQNPSGGDGRVDIYRGSADAPASFWVWNSPGNDADHLFGSAVALGDFNGDGSDDIVIGTGDDDSAGPDAGSVSVYYGGPEASDRPDWLVFGGSSGMRLGDAVATALDVNCDGFEDLLIGSPNADNGTGEARLYHGSVTGLETTPSWIGTGFASTDAYGTSVASAGDVNADGYADVVVGAPGGAGSPKRGRVHVYLGSDTGLSPNEVWSIEGDQPDAELGFCVASAGDVNGDGFSDVIAGAPRHDDPQANGGAVFIYLGNSNGISAATPWSTGGGESGSRHGHAVASAGDVNGDGFSDVIVGSPYSGGNGRADVYHGGLNESDFGLEKQWTANHPGALFGWSVGAADFNRDGLSDVVIGTPGVDNGQIDEGQVRSFRAPFDATSLWFANDGNQDYAQHGYAVATGDVSGDGFPDILSGAPGKLGEASSIGQAYLWPGNGLWQGATGGPVLGEGTQRLFRPFDLSPVKPLSLLGGIDGDEVGMAGYLRSPLGREDVQFEVEIKPTGVPFDGAGTILSSVLDSGFPTPDFGSRVPVSLTIALPSPDAYHWRARILGSRPYWKRSPWFTPARNAETETDFRRLPNPTSVEVSTLSGRDVISVSPSPFRSSTTLRFQTKTAGQVKLRILDAQGREVDLVADRELDAGDHAFSWTPPERESGRANGVYFVLLETPGDRAMTKLVRLH